jgi:hypothetical protein
MATVLGVNLTSLRWSCLALKAYLLILIVSLISEWAYGNKNGKYESE